MIPRYQRILFWVLLVASVAMAVVLIRLRERAADRIAASRDSAEVAAPQNPAPAETVTLFEANDADDTVAPVTRQLALPKETGARARVLLRQLFADYAAPASKHPLTAGPGIEEVFFMPASANGKPNSSAVDSGAQTAIVNLTGAFAENHPSGIEPETLTLLSIIDTLHENFPGVEQVRFLVDGQPRETLAGHADLTRTYLAADQARPER
jgi:Sporulation and spore germination